MPHRPPPVGDGPGSAAPPVGSLASNASTWDGSATPLARGFDLLLFDLDGVVYVGPHAVAGAVESLARAAEEGVQCAYVTNNAARTPAIVAGHLRELGIAAADDEVVTSAQEGAELLADRLPAGSQVLAVGGPGVAAALIEAGLQPVDQYAAGVAGVLQGYGPEVGWRDLAEASYAVTGGATWVATNPDLTVPTPRGTAPGNGQLTAVVARTTGIDPIVTGKPGAGLFQAALRRMSRGPDGAASPDASEGASPRALVIGDRLDTDIAGAVAAGLESLLVLTGVSGLADLLAAGPAERPTYLGADLAALWLAQPAVTLREGWWVCESARARVRDGALELAGVDEAGVDQAAVDQDGVDLAGWRVAAAAAWSAADQGEQIDLTSAIVSLEATAR